MAHITYLEAICQAQAEEMDRDPTVFLMGEGTRNGVLGTTQGFVERFGESRVRAAPVPEGGFIGVAGRAATAGKRPVVDATISSLLFPAMDQICSIIAKSRFIYGEDARLPLVIRSCLFQGDAAQHVERPYATFMNMAGMKIIAPSNARDMKGLLKAAIRDDGPVMSFEDSTCWMTTAEVPDNYEFIIPLGRGKIRRQGRDVTIVAIAGGVGVAMEAAERLIVEGISVEVIDPRTLVPLDLDLIFRSIHKTGRAICVGPGYKPCSIASEVAATIAAEASQVLRAPVSQVTTPDVRLPFGPHVGTTACSTTARIMDAARRLVGTQISEAEPQPKAA